MRAHLGLWTWVSLFFFGCGDCSEGTLEDAPIQFQDWTPAVCEGGEDEDGDGLVDCADSDCYTASACVFVPVVTPPDLPLNGVVSLWERSRWFFEEGLIQRGVEPGAITAETLATVRGQVVGFDGEPLGGAAVSVAGRPELGRTYTREDGLFDLAYGARHALFHVPKRLSRRVLLFDIESVV